LKQASLILAEGLASAEIEFGAFNT